MVVTAPSSRFRISSVGSTCSSAAIGRGRYEWFWRPSRTQRPVPQADQPRARRGRAPPEGARHPAREERLIRAPCQLTKVYRLHPPDRRSAGSSGNVRAERTRRRTSRALAGNHRQNCPRSMELMLRATGTPSPLIASCTFMYVAPIQDTASRPRSGGSRTPARARRSRRTAAILALADAAIPMASTSCRPSASRHPGCRLPGSRRRRLLPVRRGSRKPGK